LKSIIKTKPNCIVKIIDKIRKIWTTNSLRKLRNKIFLKLILIMIDLLKVFVLFAAKVILLAYSSFNCDNWLAEFAGFLASERHVVLVFLFAVSLGSPPRAGSVFILTNRGFTLLAGFSTIDVHIFNVL